MRLAGLQKLTLLDYPGELACTVFTQGCNLRCPFCQNADLVLPERFPEDEWLPEDTFFAFLESRKGRLGAVAVSGGEPTLHRDLPGFLEKIKSRGFLAKLDTNGTNPEMLRDIIDNGLADYVAMDVKNTPEKYALTCGLESCGSRQEDGTYTGILARVQQSIDLLRSGSVRYEFRTTVAEGLHTADDIVCMAEWLEGAKAWYLQQYVPGDSVIGFADSGSLSLRAPSPEKLRAMCEAARGSVPSVQVRGV